MGRHIVTLANDRLRDVAIDYVRRAKPGSRVEFKGPKRSTDANAAMWAMLSDIARQIVWHGQRLDTESWKIVFLDALRRERKDELRIVPNIDMTGFVNISPIHSSDLDGSEMHDLLSIISAFGDQQGVTWSAPEPRDKRPTPPIESYSEEGR